MMRYTTKVNFSLFINIIHSRRNKRNHKDQTANEGYKSHDEIDDGLILNANDELMMMLGKYHSRAFWSLPFGYILIQPHTSF